MIDYALSQQQLTVICALSSGATMLDAAEEAGVLRNTIANWRRNTPPFQFAFAHAQYDRALYFREKALASVDQAVQTIQDLLTDPKTPPSVRLKAALAVIQLATTPPEPQKEVLLDIEKISYKKVQPEPAASADPPQKPEIVHKKAQPDTTAGEVGPSGPRPGFGPAGNPNFSNESPADPETIPDPAQPPSADIHIHARSSAAPAQKPDFVHKNAQTPICRNQPKVGRNEPCPCGSGNKYKRCCLNKKVRTEFVQRLASHVEPKYAKPV